MNKIIRVEYDQDAECPMDFCSAWTLYSFNRKSKHYKNPDQFQEENEQGESVLSPELQEKLTNGLAFFLDYYEHGRGMYSLTGSGPQCQWDTSRSAGLLVWEHDPNDMGGKTVEDRAKDAEGFLTTYNNWMNGEVYGYSITNEKNEHLDSCWGYYESDYLTECINEHLDEGDCVIIKGDCASVIDESKIKAEVVDEFPEEEQDGLTCTVEIDATSESELALKLRAIADDVERGCNKGYGWDVKGGNK